MQQKTTGCKPATGSIHRLGFGIMLAPSHQQPHAQALQLMHACRCGLAAVAVTSPAMPGSHCGHSSGIARRAAAPRPSATLPVTWQQVHDSETSLGLVFLTATDEATARLWALCHWMQSAGGSALPARLQCSCMFPNCQQTTWILPTHAVRSHQDRLPDDAAESMCGN